MKKNVLSILVSILSVADAWVKPKPGVKWQWQIGQRFVWDRDRISGIDLYDVDLFDTDISEAKKIKENGNILVCYFEAGTWVDYDNRPLARLYPGAMDIKTKSCTRGKEICGGLGFPYYAPYTDELWIDPKNQGVLKVIAKILDYARDLGCDLVEPDNTNGYDKHSYCTGFEPCNKDKCAPFRTQATQKQEDICPEEWQEWKHFNIWLAEEAHARGMGCLLKNNPVMSKELVNSQDGVVSESCLSFNECQHFQAMRNASKPILMCAYNSYKGVKVFPLDTVCAEASNLRYDAIYKHPKLQKDLQNC